MPTATSTDPLKDEERPALTLQAWGILLDLPLVQHHGADHLHIEVVLA